MGAFEYAALDAQGRERKGLIEGDTPKHVRQLLREKQLLPMDIQEAAQREQQQQGKRRPFMRRGLSTLDLALLTRQLATLLRSGLPLEETLQAVAEQTEKPRVQRIILGVRSKVVEGHPLADGLRDFPQAFPEIYRATVSAGEQSGKLDSVLERLADYTESRQVMGQQVSNALVYPIVLLVLSLRHRLLPPGLRRAAGGRGVRVRPPGAAARHADPDRHERSDPPLLVSTASSSSARRLGILALAQGARGAAQGRPRSCCACRSPASSSAD